MYFDYYIFMIPALALVMIAQFYVNAAYRRWSKVRNSSNLNGKETVNRLVQSAGLDGFRVELVGGNLTDHYDPRNKVLRLSSGVAETPSVASLAIAAHELGHVQQHQQGYFPLQFRSALVPMVNIGSSLGWIMIFGGLLLNMTNLAWLGVMFFSGGALFSLATLPVEINASRRARQMLVESGIVTEPKEERGVRSVLNAAALTYVAALFQAIMQLLYFVSLIGGRRRR